MVRNYYMSLSCEEKKKAKNKYFASKEGSALKSRVNRLAVYGVLLIGFGIYVIVDAINHQDIHLQLIYGIGLIIVAALFFIGRHFVIVKSVNNYLIEEKTKVTVKAKKDDTQKATKKSTKTTKKAKK